MQKLVVLFMCVFAANILKGQSIKGTLSSSLDSSSIESAHVINISQHKMTTTDQKGAFTIDATPGDTLYISNINFKSRKFVIRDYLELQLIMEPIHIELKEVIVTEFPKNSDDFKDKMIDLPIINPNDSLPFGVTPGKEKGPVPKMYERETKLIYNGGIGLPISFFTKKFSKRHKAERDYYEAKAEMGTTITNAKKYNRELVTQLTSLEDEALTVFMGFMNLSVDFINISSEYEIAIKILNEYKAYQEFLKAGKLDEE